MMQRIENAKTRAARGIQNLHNDDEKRSDLLLIDQLCHASCILPPSSGDRTRSSHDHVTDKEEIAGQEIVLIYFLCSCVPKPYSSSVTCSIHRTTLPSSAS